jgi:hypothetical protein
MGQRAIGPGGGEAFERIDRALRLLLAYGLARQERVADTGGRPRELWHAS